MSPQWLSIEANPSSASCPTDISPLTHPLSLLNVQRPVHVVSYLFVSTKYKVQSTKKPNRRLLSKRYFSTHFSTKHKVLSEKLKTQEQFVLSKKSRTLIKRNKYDNGAAALYFVLNAWYYFSISI